MGNQLSASWFFFKILFFLQIRSFRSFSFQAVASRHSDISSRGWFLIDPTISLILWNKQASVHPATDEQQKVEQPSITGYGQLNLRSPWTLQACGSHTHTRALLLENKGSPLSPREAAGAFCSTDRPALAPRAGHLRYKMPPSSWTGTVLSQPGPSPSYRRPCPLESPAVAISCVCQ